MSFEFGLVVWLLIGVSSGWLFSKIMDTQDRRGMAVAVAMGGFGGVLGGSVGRMLVDDREGHLNAHVICGLVALIAAFSLAALTKSLTLETHGHLR